MKKYISLIIGAIAMQYATAQQLPQMSQYMYNKFILNPAIAGTSGAPEAILTLRNQWMKFTNAPRTQSLSFNMPLMNNMGVGAVLVNDKTGPVSQTGLELAYAYHLQITDDSKLSLGLSGRLWQHVLDESELTLDENNDVAITGSKNKALTPDASFGAYYFSENYYVSLSIPQLFQAKIKINDNSILQEDNKEIRHYYLMGGYKYEINDQWAVEPSVLIKTIFKAPTQIDINAKAIYKNMAWAGLSYRSKESVVILAGVTYEGFKFGYSFDATLTTIGKYSAGSHELFLGYIFGDTNKKTSTRFK